MADPKQIRMKTPLYPKQYANYEPYPMPEGIIRSMDSFFREHVKKGDFGMVKTELLQNPRYIHIALSMLSKTDTTMFVNAAIVMMDISGNVINHAAIAEAFSHVYDDGKHGQRKTVVSTLKKASEEIGIDYFMPLLADALSSDDAALRIDALEALLNSARKGGDICSAIPSLIRLLFDDDLTIRRFVSDNLWQLDIGKASEEQKSLMISALISLLNSPNFMHEAEKNSVLFVQELGNVMAFIERLGAGPAVKEAV